MYRSAEKMLQRECQCAITPAIEKMSRSAAALLEAKSREATARAAAAGAQRKADAATEAFAQKQGQEMERGAQKAIADFTAAQEAAARDSEAVLAHAVAIHAATVKAAAASREELLRLLAEVAYLENLGKQLAANIVAARAVAGVARDNLARARAEADLLSGAAKSRGDSSSAELRQQMLARLQHDRVTREAVRAQAAAALSALQAEEAEAARAREAAIARARAEEVRAEAGLAVVKPEGAGCCGGTEGRLQRLLEERDIALRSLRASTDQAVHSAFARERSAVEAAHKASVSTASGQAAAAIDREYKDTLKRLESGGLAELKAELVGAQAAAAAAQAAAAAAQQEAAASKQQAQRDEGARAAAARAEAEQLQAQSAAQAQQQLLQVRELLRERELLLSRLEALAPAEAAAGAGAAGVAAAVDAPVDAAVASAAPAPQPGVSAVSDAAGAQLSELKISAFSPERHAAVEGGPS